MAGPPMAGPPMDVRKKLAKQGKAVPDSSVGGRFPIRNEADLKKAIQAFGRAKPEDRDKIKRFIMSRARALGRADLIPDSWK